MYVIYRYNKHNVFGGVEFKILSIVKNLVRNDISVVLIIHRGNGKLSDAIDNIEGVCVYKVNSRYNANLRLIQLIRQKNVFVLQAHQFYDSLMIRICKMLTASKIYHLFRVHTHLDGYVVGFKKKVLQFLDRISSIYVDSIVTLSKTQLNDEFFDLYDSAKLKVLYNGIEGYGCVPLSKVERRFLIVGDIQSRKNQAETVKALLSLPYKVRIDIAGNVKDEEEWCRLKGYIDLDNRVVYHGMCNAKKLMQLYEGTTFVLLASKAEGLPTTLLECFSAGRLAIFSNAGSTSEVLHDGTNGFLLPGITQEDITSKVRSILELNDNELLRIAIRGRNSFDERFKEVTMVEYFRDIYEKINRSYS